MSKNKIQCSVTKEWFGISKARREKLIQEFGSEAELEKNYVCRMVKRLQKEGKSDEEIRKLAEAGEITSQTNAPKRTPKGAKAKPEETPEDPDVAAFLNGTFKA